MTAPTNLRPAWAPRPQASAKKAPRPAGAPPILEGAWLAKVRQIAELHGWTTYHTHNSQRSEPGWPDLVLGHPRQRRTVFAELKSERGFLSAPQRLWLTHLAVCGFETALWRPSDEAEAIAVLGPVRRKSVWTRIGGAS
jgi:VRR-NUC domain